MKILIVNPPIREWSKPNVFPLGLGYIASSLLEDGHEVKVLDINALRLSKIEVEEKIKNSDADVLAIGGIITVYKYIKWFVHTFKKYHPHIPIIVGGSAGSSIPHITLSKNPVDIVNIGEGEVTIMDIVYTLQNKNSLSTVKGIWYKENGIIYQNPLREPIKNLDKIPFPAWHLFPMETYLKNPIGAVNPNKWEDGNSENAPLSMNITIGRGCPYKCIYCYHDFMGYSYRHRSAENVLEEIRELYQKYKITYFHIIDDDPVISKEFIYDFCQKMQEFSNEVDNEITWGCAGRVNLMTEDMIKTMALSGCILIGYGIETGSQKMLNLIRKNATVEQAKKALLLTNKYLGSSGTAFMMGYPGEDCETIQETMDFCRECEIAPEAITFITPYPGTELYRMAMKQGKIGDEEKYILNLGEQGEVIRVNFTDFSDKELMKIHDWMIKKLGAWNRRKHK